MASKEISDKSQSAADSRVLSPTELMELQRSFFGLVSAAEQAKLDRINFKRQYEEKIRIFEEARRTLFCAAEILQQHQPRDAKDSCDWLRVARDRLEALDHPPDSSVRA